MFSFLLWEQNGWKCLVDALYRYNTKNKSFPRMFELDYKPLLCPYHWVLLNPGHLERVRVPKFWLSHRLRRWPAVLVGWGSNSHSLLFGCDQWALLWAAHCACAKCKLCGLAEDITLYKYRLSSAPVFRLNFSLLSLKSTFFYLNIALPSLPLVMKSSLCPPKQEWMV